MTLAICQVNIKSKNDTEHNGHLLKHDTGTWAFSGRPVENPHRYLTKNFKSNFQQ